MNYKPNIINVVYCCSDLFSEVCAVSIVSLFENNKDMEDINVYIIEDKISEKNRNRFYEMANRYGRKIHFIALPNPSEFYNDTRFTIKSLGRTYARMILGTVLPQDVDRVLSLDSDTIVLGAIYDLWNTDLEGYAIAGVDDCMGKIALVKTQHLPPDTAHCNAGMYLIDLNLWRSENWTNQFFKYMRDLFDSGKSLGGYEEEVINKVLIKRIKVLSPKYNLMTLEQVLSYKELLRFRQPLTYYTEEEIEEGKRNTVITHTTNFFYVRHRIFEEKSDHPMRKQYEKYRAITPWANDPKMTVHYTFKQKIQKNIWHIMPKSMAIIVGSFVRNEIRPLLARKRDDE